MDPCLCVATSTPDNTRELPDESDISIISPQPELPVNISDDELEKALRVLSAECHKQSHDVDVHEQSTLRLDTPEHSQSPRNQSENINYDQSPGRKSKSPAPDENQIIRNETEIRITEETQSPRRQNITPVPAQNQNEMVNSIPENNIQSKAAVAEENQTTRKQLDKETLRDCQCQWPCGVEDELSRSLPTTSEIMEKNKQWWLISPEEIKKIMEAIRERFMGKTQIDTSIRFQTWENPSNGSNSNRTEDTSNLQAEDSTNVSSNKHDITHSNFRKEGKIEVPQKINKYNELCECYQNNREVENIESTEIAGESSSPSLNKIPSSELNFKNIRKKSVTIQLPSQSDKYQFFDPTEDCKDDENGCHSRNINAQNCEKIVKNHEDELQQFSRGLNVHQSAEGGTIQKPCDMCDPSAECEVDEKNKELQNSETTQATEDRSNTCDFCNIKEDDEGCRARTRKQEVQDPERVNRSQGESTSLEDNRDLKLMNILKKELEEDSGGGSSCAGACERYCCDKLTATLQILENKDETIRIQASSLGVAEGRITELIKRASALQAELEHKARELSKLRCPDKPDSAIFIRDAEAQKHIVATLEDNMATIAELYRECFYETVKQEELIDLFRKSYLEVRLMEKDKSDKITRLQNVINTQKRSIEQCQDVAMEVESLKTEISSFLNSSNNDSGVWERGSEGGDVSEELADILDQLRQLQEMLTGDCTCGLEDENRSLKERNEALQTELDKVRQRNCDLDRALRQLLDQQYEKKIKEKELQLEEAHKQLADVKKSHKERGGSYETLMRQLQQAQVMLADKAAELAGARQTSAAREATITRLEQDLDRSEQQIKEGLRKLAEASQAQLEQQLESQAMTSHLEQRLQHAVQRCQDLEISCREKQAGLEEAHARGAQLCEESRRVTRYVRQCMRRKRQLAREQQEKIERLESTLRELQRRVEAGQNTPELTSRSETDPCSSNSIPREHASASESYPRCSRICKSQTTTFLRCDSSLARCIQRKSERASCPKCESNRQECGSETASGSKCAFNRQDKSGSGMARCAQAPVPPRRLKKRQQSCDELDYPWSGRESSSLFPDTRWLQLPRPSPTDDVMERLQHLQMALDASQRRWGRARR